MRILIGAMTGSIMAASALAQAGSNPAAGISDRTPAQARVGAFDIDGVRLGMTMHDAMRAIAAAGYVRAPVCGRCMGYTVPQMVSRRVAAARGMRYEPRPDAIVRLDGSKGGSRISVVLTPLPGEPRVSSVSRVMAGGAAGFPSMQGALSRVVGPPSRASSRRAAWGGDYRAACDPARQKCLVLSVDGGSLGLTLSDGGEQRRAQEAYLSSPGLFDAGLEKIVASQGAAQTAAARAGATVSRPRPSVTSTVTWDPVKGARVTRGAVPR